MFRLSWALTVLGAQQAAQLIEAPLKKANEFEPGSKPSATSPFDAVANVAEEQFGGVLRGLYRTGRESLL